MPIFILERYRIAFVIGHCGNIGMLRIRIGICGIYGHIIVWLNREETGNGQITILVNIELGTRPFRFCGFWYKAVNPPNPTCNRKDLPF